MRHNHTFTAGVGLCHADGQIIGFGAGALEHDAVELVRHSGKDILRVMQDVLVQVAGVSVEHRCLLGQGFDHARMAMPNGGHVVVHVEVFLAIRIPQMGADALHQVDRIAVEQTVCGAEHVALLGQFAGLRIKRGRHFRAETVGVHDGRSGCHDSFFRWLLDVTQTVARLC